MDPYLAADAPRMDPIREDYTIEVESRIPQSVTVGFIKAWCSSSRTADVRLSHGFISNVLARCRNWIAKYLRRSA